jgi:hypothetical protein
MVLQDRTCLVEQMASQLIHKEHFPFTFHMQKMVYYGIKRYMTSILLL